MPEGQYREMSDLFKIKRSVPGHDREIHQKSIREFHIQVNKMGELHISKENLGHYSNNKDLTQAGLTAQNNRHMNSQNGVLLSTVCVLMDTHI